MSSLPKATVVRLPRYLRLLDDAATSRDTVKSSELAEAAGVNAANVRRDLSYLDFHGVRGVGYSVYQLRDRIRQELGIADRKRVAIVGAGNLGKALANYGGLGKRGFDVVAVYDSDTRKVGSVVGPVSVQSMEELTADGSDGKFDMAIVAVPDTAAQRVANQLVDAGSQSILNFAPVRLDVPDSVSRRQVDLSMELQVLSYYGARP